jgi:hypothetical protein
MKNIGIFLVCIAALLIASLVIWAIQAKAPRYSVAVNSGAIVRLNIVTGETWFYDASAQKWHAIAEPDKINQWGDPPAK